MRYLLGLLVLCFSACGADAPVVRDADHAKQIEQMYQDYKSDMFPALADIGPLEASKMLAAGDAIIIDARSAEEQAVSIVPGAIMASDFKPETMAQGRQIIVYCTIGVRSAFACNGFLQKDYQALNLRGGIVNWIAHGYEVLHNGKPVKRVHTYGKKWALVSDDYEKVY